MFSLVIWQKTVNDFIEYSISKRITKRSIIKSKSNYKSNSNLKSNCDLGRLCLVLNFHQGGFATSRAIPKIV